jgi:hypothetical protein
MWVIVIKSSIAFLLLTRMLFLLSFSALRTEDVLPACVAGVLRGRWDLVVPRLTVMVARSTQSVDGTWQLRLQVVFFFSDSIRLPHRQLPLNSYILRN